MSIEKDINLSKQDHIIVKSEESIRHVIIHHTASDQAFGMLLSPMGVIHRAVESVHFALMTKPKLI